MDSCLEVHEVVIDRSEGTEVSNHSLRTEPELHIGVQVNELLQVLRADRAVKIKFPK